jgi:glycosyltransferase involved in cell wall biosynthesis
MAGHLRDGRFDIAHCFGTGPTITGSLAAALAGVTPIGAARSPYTRQGVVRCIHRVADRYIAAWIVNSRGIAESLTEVLGIKPEKCVVVYNRIDTELFSSSLAPAEAKRRIGVDPEHQVVSIVARLRPEKNHGLFLRAASLLLAHRPATRFAIVGDGECRSALEELAASMGIADRVLFLGSRTDVADLLAGTDMSVLTSDYEGLPNALIESMCMGVPIVATNYAGVEEVVTDGRGGFVVPRGDAAALGERVGRLLDQAALRHAMGRCGRQSVTERFSLRVMCDRLLRAYDTCVQGSRGALAGENVVANHD